MVLLSILVILRVWVVTNGTGVPSNDRGYRERLRGACWMRAYIGRVDIKCKNTGMVWNYCNRLGHETIIGRAKYY